MLKALIGPVISLIGSHFDRKAEEKRAVHERKMQAIKQDTNWENIHASNADNSWRDEFFSVLFAVPLVLSFIGPCVPYVQAGFDVLQTMPEWYKAMLAGLVASSVGLRGLTKWKG